ncbi:MAG: mechanosensitive ion channel family protein [Anaerolineae bacterium]
MIRSAWTEPVWWSYALRVAIFYLAAWVVHRFSGRIARLVYLDRLSPEQRRSRPERLATLRGLVASAITFLAFAAATFSSLSLAVETDTLVWMIGLFSAAFGLGARPLLSDFLTGVSFMFEDTFDVGEKVELLGLGGGPVEGVIEAVNLRTTQVRAPSGELYTVPNGEVRVVRNFSRGRFSIAHVKLKTSAEGLPQALTLLEALGKEAVIILPNLLEPWQIISESGVIGQQAELTLITKTKFGKAAEMLPRLLALVHERFAGAELSLFD